MCWTLKWVRRLAVTEELEAPPNAADMCFSFDTSYDLPFVLA